MLKKILLLVGATLALITAGSAEIPIPPCYPNCTAVVPTTR
jgi:hypothetical protein